jgi:hypothetical protein
MESDWRRIMTTDRKKPGVAFWATVALVVVLVVYPLSFGPACWLDSRTLLPAWSVRFLRSFYSPMLDGPKSVRDALMWYGYLWYPYEHE